MAENKTERWQLGSGTWHRDRQSGKWRLVSTANGTAVNDRLSTEDVAHMIGAMRDASRGQWFPPDFSYSPETGDRLEGTVASAGSTWVPPHGAAALSDLTRPLTRGLRQTPLPLTLARSNNRVEPATGEDRRLPALAPGEYRFLVHRFDAALPTLVAAELEHGHILVLLPESNTWMGLEHPADKALPESHMNFRGWRMEVVEGSLSATLYLPTVHGLAVITPSLIALSYAVEYVGEGPAVGGPVAWAGGVWLPVLGANNCINLVGKSRGATPPMVVPTGFSSPKNGFEAPVFDALHVIWPSDEGQLILRMHQNRVKYAEWLGWPDGLTPAFSLGCPYFSPSGSFWQVCRAGPNQPLEYVQMGQRDARRIPVAEPRLGTGHVSYMKKQRLAGDPWREPDSVIDSASSDVVVPLIESQVDRVAVGMRIDAPQGILARLDSDEESRAVLQSQAENQRAVPFGTLRTARPWLASLFVYDAHLWVYHPQLSQALGWKLAQ